jgi:putative ABC transport system permease protein
VTASLALRTYHFPLRFDKIGAAYRTAGGVRIDSVLRALLAGAFQPDAGTFLIVTAVLAAAGGLACTIPALRASRVDPVVALRFE